MSDGPTRNRSLPIAAVKYASLGAVGGFAVAFFGQLPAADQTLFATLGAAVGLVVLILVVLSGEFS